MICIFSLNAFILCLIFMQQLLHYFLHLIFPGFVAYRFFKSKWKKAYFIMLATMLVDLDHLIATPVFDACRCSIGFHPLHTYAAIAVYFIFLIPSQTRVIALGLLLHMATDLIDCVISRQSCV